MFGERAIIFLVISCPCALVLSVPLTFFSGIGAASKRGVLFKSSSDLEMIKNVDTFVFDKTGTLTKGIFEVKAISNVSNFTEKELIEYVAAAESNSNHPIAKSILKKNKRQFNPNDVEIVEDEFGKGIEAIYNGKNILVGNFNYLKEKQINVVSCNDVGTIVYVSIDRIFCGAIVISDTIKDSSKETVEYLKNSDKMVLMVTGDNSKTANMVAAELGIDNVYYEQLPLQKSKIINELRKTGKCVAFIGDGINDAPVLTTSSLGISMGGIGSDVAIEASDVVLMHDEPRGLISAIEVSKKTDIIAKQNIIFSLAVKVVTMVFGAIGLPYMLWIAVFADVGVALLAVLNAMRILYNKKI